MEFLLAVLIDVLLLRLLDKGEEGGAMAMDPSTSTDVSSDQQLLMLMDVMERAQRQRRSKKKGAAAVKVVDME